jgi:hypothetical protein
VNHHVLKVFSRSVVKPVKIRLAFGAPVQETECYSPNKMVGNVIAENAERGLRAFARGSEDQLEVGSSWMCLHFKEHCEKLFKISKQIIAVE